MARRWLSLGHRLAAGIGDMDINNYTPQVGDRVRLIPWGAGRFSTVTAIGVRNFLGIDEHGIECAWRLGIDWVKVEPYDAQWVNIYKDDLIGTPAASREQAEIDAFPNRLGVIEINLTKRTVTWHDVDGNQ